MRWWGRWLWLVALGLWAAAGEPLSGEAQALFEQGVSAKRSGRYAEAVERLDAALKVAPESPDIWYALAWTLDSSAKLKDATAAFRQAAARMAEGDPRRAEALRCLEKYEKALAPRPPLPAPPPPHWSRWLPTGPALVLLLLLVGLCGSAWAWAGWQQLGFGAGSPAGQFHALCLALGRGELAAGRRLLALARADKLGVPPADVAVALTLAARHWPAVRDELARWLGLPAAQPRLIAALALSRLGDQPEPERWLDLLTESDRRLRACAVAALAQSALPAAAEPLAALTASRDPDLARAALVALGAYDDDATAEALAARLDDPRPGLAATALAALSRRATLPASLLEPLGAQLDVARVPLLAACGAAAAGVLVAALGHADPAVRGAARDALLLDPRQRFSPLPPAGRAALTALAPVTAELLAVAAAQPAEDGDPVLLAALAADSYELRDLAVDWLAARGGEAAVEPLRAALRALPTDLDEPGRAHLRRLCTALTGCRGVAALGELLALRARWPAEPALGQAVRALAATGAAGPALAAAAREPRLSDAALALLADYPYPEAADALLDRLPAQAAVRALGRLREPRARDPLAALRPGAQGALADALDVALARLGDREAAQRVEAMLVRGEWSERRPAADYFRELPAVAPRAAAVLAEAEAHRAALALLDEGGDQLPQRLAGLGKVVRPTLRDLLLAGPPHRHVAAEALTLLGSREAQPAADSLDRADVLLALGSEAARRELAGMEFAGPELVTNYIRRRLPA